jgi:hypothetical protein
MTEQLNGKIRIGDVVKNSLPEEVSLKESRVSIKGRFALCGAIEVVPRLRGHPLARNRP